MKKTKPNANKFSKISKPSRLMFSAHFSEIIVDYSNNLIAYFRVKKI